jgi:predicted ATPase
LIFVHLYIVAQEERVIGVAITFNYWGTEKEGNYCLLTPRSYDVTIFDEPVHFDITHRATILHGINGIGKTTLLKAIAEQAKKTAIYADCNDHPYLDVDTFIPSHHVNFPKYIRAINDLLCNKQICTLKPFGLYFQSGSKGAHPFQWFSDGEKNVAIILALAYFSAARILLLDHVERSLHCAIQERLITALLRASDKLYIIVTHSPQIIGEHRELAVGMGRDGLA